MNLQAHRTPILKFPELGIPSLMTHVIVMGPTSCHLTPVNQ